MKTAFFLFFVLMFFSTYARAQQTFNSVKIKDLEMPSETVSSVLYLNGDKKVKTASSVSFAELEHLDGVTSPIQTQLNTVSGQVSTNTSAISTKEPAVTGTTSADYYRGDKTFQTLNKTAVGLGNVDNTSDATKNAASATLTNKTITGASIQSPTRLDPKKDTLANLTTYAATAQNGELVYSTDTKAFYTVTDAALVAAGGAGGGDPGILTNGGFDSGLSSWTLTAGSSAADTSDKIEGTQAIAITLSAQALSLKQSSTVNASSIAGLQGLGYMYALAPAGTSMSLCAVQAGTTSTTLCDTKTATGAYQLFKIPFILSATSSGIELKSAAAVTGVVKVDKGFLGAVDLKQDVQTVATQSSKWTAGSTTTGQIFSGTATTDGSGNYTVSSGTLTALRDINLSMNCSGTTAGATTIIVSITAAGASGPIDNTVVGTGNTASTSWSGKLTTGQTAFCSNTSGNTASSGYVTVLATNIVNTSAYSSTNSNTGWTSFTPTGQWTTNITYTGKWRRVGGDMEIQYNLLASTTPTGSSLTLNMPTGYTIDSARLIATAAGVKRLGEGTVNDTGVASYDAVAYYNSASVIDVYRTISSPGTNPVHVQTSANVTTSAPVAFGAGDSVNITVRVPITGWEDTNVIAGSFKEYQLVGARAYSTAGTSYSNGPTTYVYATEDYDTHSAFSSNTFTVPSGLQGYYEVCAKAYIGGTVTTAQYIQLFARKNSTSSYFLSGVTGNGANVNFHISGCTTLALNGADTVDIRISTNTAGNQAEVTTANFYNVFEIKRVGTL